MYKNGQQQRKSQKFKKKYFSNNENDINKHHSYQNKINRRSIEVFKKPTLEFAENKSDLSPNNSRCLIMDQYQESNDRLELMIEKIEDQVNQFNQIYKNIETDEIKLEKEPQLKQLLNLQKEIKQIKQEKYECKQDLISIKQFMYTQERSGKIKELENELKLNQNMIQHFKKLIAQLQHQTQVQEKNFERVTNRDKYEKKILQIQDRIHLWKQLFREKDSEYRMKEQDGAIVHQQFLNKSQLQRSLKSDLTYIKSTNRESLSP